MMDTLTPLTRRVVAIGVFVLLLLCGLTLIVIPLIEANHTTLRDLANVRAALARALEIRDAPPLREVVEFPPRVGVAAPTADAAQQSLAGYVARNTAERGLQALVRTQAVSRARAPAPITLTISVIGPRDQLLDWMSAIERGRPAVRFASWQLVGAGGGPLPVSPSTPMEGAPISGPPIGRSLRLEATVTALWAGRQ